MSRDWKSALGLVCCQNCKTRRHNWFNICKISAYSIRINVQCLVWGTLLVMTIVPWFSYGKRFLSPWRQTQTNIWTLCSKKIWFEKKGHSFPWPECNPSLFVKVVQILVQGKISRPPYSDKSPSRSTVTTKANSCHSGGKWTQKVVMVMVMVVGLTLAQFSFIRLGLKCTTDNTILGVNNHVMGGGGSIFCRTNLPPPL